MPERWIKLRLHPEHRRIHQLSEHMRVERNDAFAMAVRWLRYLDADPNAAKARFSVRAINDIVRAPATADFASAALSVGWLAGRSDGTLIVRNYSRWLVKDRTANERQRRHRSRVTVTTDQTRVKPDQSRVDSEGQTVMSDQQTANALTAPTDKLKAGIELVQAVQLLREAGIAPNNFRSCSKRLERIASPLRFMRRILAQCREQQLVGAYQAGYVFNAIKSESKGTSDA